MTITLDIEWKTHVQEGVKQRMERAIRTHCTDFFRWGGNAELKLFVVSLNGKDSTDSRMILLAPEHRVKEEHFKGGVAVHVRNEGKKTVLGYLVVAGMEPGKLRELITMGPISRPRASRRAGAEPLRATSEMDGGDAREHLQPETRVGSEQGGDQEGLLRLFWETILHDHQDDIEGDVLPLANKELSERGVNDLSITDSVGKRAQFYLRCVRPFGVSTGRGSVGGWKLNVPLIRAFIDGGPLPVKKLHGGGKPKKAEKAPDPARSPEMVLGELEDLVLRVELTRKLKDEQAKLASERSVTDGELKKSVSEIDKVERTLAELRSQREVLRKSSKAATERLEEIERLLAENAVSEETLRRMQALSGAMRVLGSTGSDTVVSLVLKEGKG